MIRYLIPFALTFAFLVACAPIGAPEAGSSNPTSIPPSPAPVAPTVPPLSVPRFKLFVANEGLYRVTAAALRAAGANIDALDATTLQLFNGDREIPVRVSGDKGNFTVEFFGEPSASPYSVFNVYWLTWGARPGKRMRESAGIAPSGAPKDSVQDTIRVNRPALYSLQAGTLNDRWFMQSLTAPATTTLTVTLPSALPVAARMRVNLWGTTQDTVSPDHHATLFFNNTRVLDEKWDGQGARTVTATLAANTIKPGENALRVSMPGDTKAQVEVALIRSFDVTYTRKLVAQDDALVIEAGNGTWRVEGFSADAIDLFDITDPADPVRITNATVAARAVTFGANALRRWLVAGPNGRKSPTRVAAMSNVDVRSAQQRADYVIVTYPDFVNALQPLVKHRTDNGLIVRVFTIGDVYDNFSGGIETPYAARDFFRWTQTQWSKPAPRFALLVGKASYDFRDYTNAPNKNLVPTFLVDTLHLNEAAADNWFVAADEKSASPTMALGRIPAKTPDQVKRVVDKIIAYEKLQPADWHRRAVYVTDDKEPEFSAMADELAGTLPSNFQTNKVYLADRKGDLPGTRNDILARWNAGAWMLSYIGHGSVDTWAAGPLFSAENLKEIKNGERLPVLVTPTCLDGFFYHPQKDSLTEEALFKNDGGIVAGIVPTGLSLPEAQKEMMRHLYAEIFQNNTLTWGEVLQRAKQKMRGDVPEMREVIETFVLLGDPALRVTYGK